MTHNSSSPGVRFLAFTHGCTPRGTIGHRRGSNRRTRRLKLGASFDYSMEVGSLTTASQLQRVEEHVKDALEKGATLVAGGRRRPDLGPLFYEPTILTGVREGMKVFAEETFGPVVSVYSVANAEEAVERANATNYGLSASIWTRDTKKGAWIAPGPLSLFSDVAKPRRRSSLPATPADSGFALSRTAAGSAAQPL